MSGERTELERAFAEARLHDTGDELARLFARAADLETQPRGRAFMLTQALALGLEAGLPEAETWAARLDELAADRP